MLDYLKIFSNGIPFSGLKKNPWKKISWSVVQPILNHKGLIR
jgi:hypothetical protein